MVATLQAAECAQWNPAPLGAWEVALMHTPMHQRH